jgi:hypothetical protein
MFTVYLVALTVPRQGEQRAQAIMHHGTHLHVRSRLVDQSHADSPRLCHLAYHKGQGRCDAQYRTRGSTRYTGNLAMLVSVTILMGKTLDSAVMTTQAKK